MSFYTFIMNYNGRTYVSQVESLEVSEINEFGQKSKEKLIEQMKLEEAVLLKSLKNVWCVSAIIRGELVFINFVQTETSDK